MLQTLTDKGYELNYISKKIKISLSKLKIILKIKKIYLQNNLKRYVILLN